MQAQPRRPGVDHPAEPIGTALREDRVAAALRRDGARGLRGDYLLGNHVDEPLEILGVQHGSSEV